VQLGYTRLNSATRDALTVRDGRAWRRLAIKEQARCVLYRYARARPGPTPVSLTRASRSTGALVGTRDTRRAFPSPRRRGAGTSDAIPDGMIQRSESIGGAERSTAASRPRRLRRCASRSLAPSAERLPELVIEAGAASLDVSTPAARASDGTFGTWLTTAEATAYLRLPSTRALYKRVERGQVPAHRWGRQFRFRRRDLEALLTSSVVSAVASHGD